MGYGVNSRKFFWLAEIFLIFPVFEFYEGTAVRKTMHRQVSASQFIVFMVYFCYRSRPDPRGLCFLIWSIKYPKMEKLL
jgi:hypothetical protein